jgi:hypothetical protein
MLFTVHCLLFTVYCFLKGEPIMTKPLVALYWIKVNSRPQRQPAVRSRNEDAPATHVATNNHRPQPQDLPLSPWRKMQNKLKLSNR